MSGNQATDDRVSLHLRLEGRDHQRLAQAAAGSLRSLQKEILFRLRTSLDAERSNEQTGAAG